MNENGEIENGAVLQVSLPSLAYLPPLITLMHSAMTAPELSMTDIVPLSPIMLYFCRLLKQPKKKTKYR
jgi:positive regulator of sigma E activity